jgi:hypothetical protein
MKGRTYHPRVEVNYSATMPFIRAFPKEALEQHMRFLTPTNPPDNSSKLEEVRLAVEEQMAALEPPRFVVTSAPGSNAPLELKAEAPAAADEKPQAPRFEPPPPPRMAFVQPQHTHGPLRQVIAARTAQAAIDPAPQLGTEHIVVIIGAGVLLGLGWWLYSKWGAGAVIEAAADASN